MAKQWNSWNSLSVRSVFDELKIKENKLFFNKLYETQSSADAARQQLFWQLGGFGFYCVIEMEQIFIVDVPAPLLGSLGGPLVVLEVSSVQGIFQRIQVDLCFVGRNRPCTSNGNCKQTLCIDILGLVENRKRLRTSESFHIRIFRSCRILRNV